MSTAIHIDLLEGIAHSVVDPLGYTLEDLRSDSREVPLPDLKTMFAAKASEQGFNVRQMSEFMLSRTRWGMREALDRHPERLTDPQYQTMWEIVQ